jgi:hypothetical protein
MTDVNLIDASKELLEIFDDVNKLPKGTHLKLQKEAKQNLLNKSIKVKAYQKRGIPTGKLEEEFEFCCWQSLYEWLKSWDTKTNGIGKSLYKCKDCEVRNAS